MREAEKQAVKDIGDVIIVGSKLPGATRDLGRIGKSGIEKGAAAARQGKNILDAIRKTLFGANSNEDENSCRF